MSFSIFDFLDLIQILLVAYIVFWFYKTIYSMNEKINQLQDEIRKLRLKQDE